MAEDHLQQFVDREAIIKTIQSYAFGVDFRDWDLFGSIFTDPFDVDLTSLGLKNPAIRVAEWVDIVRSGLSGYKGTQHLLSNFRINLDDDRASTIVYFQATHYLPNDQGDNHNTLAGYYNHTLTRTAQGWKIRKLVLNVVWTEGNYGLGALAAQQWQAAQGK